MEPCKRPSHRIVAIAVAFEAALGLAAVALSSYFHLPLAQRLRVTQATAVRSCFALLPMLLLLWIAMHTHWRPIATLRRQVQRMVREMFAGVGWAGLAMVSLAAGVGEELLFRGALQPLAERWLGPLNALIIVSVVFGALHAASWLYFLLAAAVGVYFGWLAQSFDDLTAPILVHSLYDFAALMALQKHAPLE
jgi:membrane protease YdiL (CAAX protease family)